MILQTLRNGSDAAIAQERIESRLVALSDTHEKYGALSVPRGRVCIRRARCAEGAGSVLNFLWRESGGPPVRTPARRGFGSRLVERAPEHDPGGESRPIFAPAAFPARSPCPFPTSLPRSLPCRLAFSSSKTNR